MSHYVDGFVIPVPISKKEDYRKLAEMAAPVFREHGALAVVECWGDDVPVGELTSFPRAVIGSAPPWCPRAAGGTRPRPGSHCGAGR